MTRAPGFFASLRRPAQRDLPRALSRTAPWLILAFSMALAALTVAAFLRATESFGLGVRTDSVEYLWAAENLAKGAGLGRLDGLGSFRPMTHWPPFYPALLAVFEAAGMGALAGARWLGAVIDGLIILLAGLTAWRMTRSPGLALAAPLALFLSPGFWNVTLDAMSEPLFLLLGMAGALCLDRYLTGRKKRWFAACAAIFALAVITRYAGAAYVLAAAVVIFLYTPGRPLERIRPAALFCALCALPLAGWMARNLLLAGSATNRYLNVIPIPASDYALLKATLSGWLSPALRVFEIGPGKALIFFGSAGLFWLWARAFRQDENANRAPQSTLPAFYAVFTIVYLAFIWLSRLYFDSLITFWEERIIYPVYVAGLLLGLFAAGWLLRRASRRWLAAGMLLVGLYAAAGWTFARLYQEPRAAVLEESTLHGRGLSKDGSLREVFKQVAKLPAGTLFFTDNIEILYYGTGRNSFQLNERGDAAVRRVSQYAQDRPVALVFFYTQSLRDTFSQPAVQFTPVYQSENGWIFTSAPR